MTDAMTRASMSLAVASLAFLTTLWGQAIVFTRLLDLVGISALLLWGAIGLISLRFRAAWTAQGRSTADLPYARPLFLVLPVGVVLLAMLLFVAEGYAAVMTRPFSARVSVGYCRSRTRHAWGADAGRCRTSWRRTLASRCLWCSMWAMSFMSGACSGGGGISCRCWKWI